MKPEPILILLAEDDPAHVTAILRAFDAGGPEFKLEVVGSLQEFRRFAASRRPAIAVMDLNLPDGRAAEVLTQPPEAGPFPILVMTSYGNEQMAVTAIKAGALDYVVKSAEAFADMPHTITRVLHEWNLLQERRQAETALLEKEEWFRTVFENASDGMFFLSESGEIVSANKSFAAMHGYTVAEILKMNLKDLGAPEIKRLFPERVSRILAGENLTLEVVHRHKEGHLFPLEVTANLIRVGGRKLILASHRDITARKRAENELQKVNRALRLTSQCNQEMVRATDESALLQAICRIAVEDGGYRMAWVGFAEPDEARSVRPVAQAGFEDGYLGTVNITWADTERGRGPTGMAIRTGQPVLARNIPTDPAYEPWRAAAIQRGYASSIALPLSSEGRCFGALMMYAGELDAFDPKEVVLLAELANDLAYGIDMLRQRTERKRAEDALRRNEEMLKRSQHVARLGHYSLDAGSGDWTSSETLDDIFGIDAAFKKNVAGWSQLIHPGDRDAMLVYLQDYVLKGRHPFDKEYRIVRANDGSLRWVHGIGELRFNDSGEVLEMFGIIQDITERKRAEEELRLGSAALEAAANAIVITDRAGIIRWANPAFTTFTGYTLAEALGKNPSLLKSGKHDPAFYKSLWDTILSGQVWRGEVTNRRKDGTFYTEEMTITPVRNERGEIGHFIAIKQDVTEKKKLQAQLLRTQRLESVGRLASGVAHDLNNILAPMLMAPPLLREELKDPELQSLVDLIETNAQRGSDIIKQLLTFGRGVEGERVPVQLRALVLDMAGIIRETFPKNITVRRETPTDVWPVKGDATQLHQILMNLCVNARDAMPKGGTLTLELENHEIDESFARMMPGARSGRYVCLNVADSGEGIAPEHLDKIYDPFFTTKDPGQGTGLGLSTVLGIVQSHGGFIQVQSQPGHGTQFKIYLPASDTAAAQPASQEEQPVPQGHGELVLMVDDEQSVRQVARHFLECNGYRMIEAENGITGIVQYKAHQQEVQVVVTDLIMPVMDGSAFIRVLRRMDPQIRVIVMSGHEVNPGRFADLGLPDDARLVKPFSGAMLLQTLQNMLHPDTPPKN